MRRLAVSSRLPAQSSKLPALLGTLQHGGARSYCPLPVRGSRGPRGGRARAPGKLPAVPSTIQHRQLDPVPVPESLTEATSRTDEATTPRPGWTPPFPASTRPDVKYDWTNYDSQPVAAGEDAGEQELAKVDVTPDPMGVLQPGDLAEDILAQPALVVVRQLEMLNLFIGFEQANKYALLTPSGKTVGYLAEEDLSLASTLTRQLAGTHRPFKATIMDTHGRVVLRMRRPFSFINSKIFVEKVTEDGERATVIGEAQQEWHPWRRRYNLFLRRPKSSDSLDSSSPPPPPSTPTSTAMVPSAETTESDHYLQFARIDSGLLAWDFYPTSATGTILSSINRNFTGFAREIFTDTGQYIIRFDAVGEEIKQIDQVREEADNKVDEAAKERARMGGLVNESQYEQRTLEKGQKASDVMPNLPVKAEAASGGLALDQRAVLLATAVSIDFDYFTRSSSRGGLFSPPLIMFPGTMGGGGGGDVPAAGGSAGADIGTGAGVGMMEGTAGGAYDDNTAQHGMPTSGGGGSATPAPSDAGADNGEGWSDSPMQGWNGEEHVGGEDVLDDPWQAPKADENDGWGDIWGNKSGGGDSGGGGDGEGWGDFF